jgi:anti-sigma regulatory factor (Ser/Thr protein kinase)
MAPSEKLSLSRSYPAQAGSVRKIREAVRDLAARAGASGAQLDAIRLAVAEAANNVVLHAYRAAPGKIHVTAAAGVGELTVLLADDGCGPNQPARSPGLGWGWKLIAEASDELSISERADGGTEILISWRIGADQSARGSESSATRPASPPFSTTT